MNKDSQSCRMRTFTGLVVLSQLLGVLSVALVATWMGVFRGGYSWHGASLFNYHPLFMVIGLIFLYGDAIMVYRVFRNEKKASVKIFHVVLQLCALLFSILALIAVFVFHVEQDAANLYSLHSWLGLLAISLFALQFIGGLLAYLSPWLGYSRRAQYTPHHRFWGMTIYGLALVTALLGIVEKTLFSIQSSYSELPEEALVINCLGITLVANGCVVLYVVTRDEYQQRLLSLPDNSVDE